MKLVAVKTFKLNFRKLTDLKLIFVTCKSVSAMTGPTSYILQRELFKLAILFSNYLLYNFNATQSQFFLKVLDIFVFLDPLDILSHYADIDISHWLKEDVH